MKQGCSNYIITYNSKPFNLLKQLGIKTSLKGTRFMLDAISITIHYENEYFDLENIYKKLSSKYDLSTSYIKWAIKYALDTRNINLSKKNFEKIFGYEYNEYSFTNKELIQEIVRVIQYEIYENIES